MDEKWFLIVNFKLQESEQSSYELIEQMNFLFKPFFDSVSFSFFFISLLKKTLRFVIHWILYIEKQ